MSHPIHVSDVLALLYPHALDHAEQEDLDRGRYLHEQMEIWVNNQIHGCAQPTTLPFEVGKVTEWLLAEQVECQAAEEVQAHAYGFIGTPDFLGAWRKKDLWIDWKFAEAVTEQNQVQGCAYTFLTGRSGLFLQCTKAGKVTPIRCKPNPHLLNAFLNGLGVLKFRASRRPAPVPQAILETEAAQLKETLCQTES